MARKWTDQPPGKDKKKPNPLLTSLSISGPAAVNENSTTHYTCTGHYSDGSTVNLTSQASWTVSGSAPASISWGLLTTGEVASEATCTINAAYAALVANMSVDVLDVKSPTPEPDPDPDPNPDPVNGRIVIDPITRIEGHLRIETQVENGAVSAAWSTGTLFRGIETILKGRRPEDAWLFTQRLCGVCTYVHGASSVRCVEDALNLTVPDNARIVRNLLMGAQYLHDHIVHFYHLHALDWVDLVSALNADPSATAALAGQVNPGADVLDYATIQARLKGLVESGQLGPFTNAYWGHPAYRLNAEANLLLAGHYLQALALQARTARMHAIFGGKNPHVQSLNVGGVTCRYDLTSSRISEFRSLLAETKQFIDTVYVPDVEYLTGPYGDWATVGGNQNFLAFGEFPEGTAEPDSLFFPRGVIFNRGAVQDVDLGAVDEHVRHSWYSGSTARHPAVGETVPAYTGLDTADRYSWLKAPRYLSEPMEVGPLARVLVGYKRKNSAFVQAVDRFLGRTGLEVDALYSTLGRTAARALETQIIANAMGGWLDQIDTSGSTRISWTMPAQASGVGLNEAPRGALGHWINIDNQTIANYQMVVPSTWNFGPRCAANKPGPAESAIVNTPVHAMNQPLEILRTVHSLDPCIACAVHVIDPDGNDVYTVKVS
jgi:[NiFe] hydrogenase large subunit